MNQQTRTICFLFLSAAIVACKHSTVPDANSTGSIDLKQPETHKADSTKVAIPTDFGLTPVQKGVWGSDPFVKDGAETTRYPNGLLKTQGNYLKGLRDGPWYSWYSNGTPWSETSFEKGLKSGPTKTFYSNGKLRYDGFYKADRPTGNWKFYDESGKLVRQEHYK